MGWAIYYADGLVFTGASKGDWRKAPNTGVQVMVVHEAPSDPFPVGDRLVSGIVGCNRLKPNVTFYTGADFYDPLNYGSTKEGSLLPDADYFAIWDRAYGDN